MKTNVNSREAALMAGLFGAVVVIALGLAGIGGATWLEAFSFVTGALCVWLTVTQNIWNFPIGLINVATYCVVFFQSRLFADAGLQVVYFILGLSGWYLWARRDGKSSALEVSRATPIELVLVLAFIVVGTVGLWQALQHVGGAASFWDALTSSLSLASQWLLNRKRLESWVGWIVVDILYVPLYIYKELYLTAILYGLFLGMATMGLRAWRTSWQAHRMIAAVGPLPRAELP